MMRHEIWYSVENCGDGSAYPKVMESEDLCEIDQAFMEGWGESCVGCIYVESDGPITVKDTITVAQEIKDVEEYLEDAPMDRNAKGKLALLKALAAKGGR